jgi:perosamine synthetase
VNKLITTGEGGMITTANAKLKKKIELLKNHGMSKNKKYFHPILGYNYRMTNLQAAIGAAQLKKLSIIMKRRRFIAQTYRKLLDGIPGLTFQKTYPDREAVCWLFSFLSTLFMDTRATNLLRILTKME